MKHVFVVLRALWNETDEPKDEMFDHSSFPVAVFDSYSGAKQFIVGKLSSYPSERVHSNGEYKFFYEDDGHEFDAFEIFELTIAHVRNTKSKRITNDLAKWIKDMWNECPDVGEFNGLPRGLGLRIEWNKETDQEGHETKYLDLDLINKKGKKVRDSCYTSYSADDAEMLAESIIKETKEGTYKSK